MADRSSPSRSMLSLTLLVACVAAACGGAEEEAEGSVTSASSASTAGGTTGTGPAATTAPAVTTAPPVTTAPSVSTAPAASIVPSPPSASPAPAPATVAGISLLSHGAVCDGRTDNSSAIAGAIAAAKSSSQAVVVPVGVCAYGDLIRLDGVKLVGLGSSSVLHSLNWRRQAIFVYGSGSEIRNLTLTGVSAPGRQADWEMTRITLFGATNFVIDSIAIEGSAAAGIQTAQAANNGRITNSTIRNTLSDAIHMTDRAGNIEVSNNRIENAGDDGIAVVSYQSDGGLVHDITARNNVVLNNRWGRQMSVVGGRNVLYENNRLENNLSSWACLYVAQENSYATFGARDVIARNNTLRNCGGQSTYHGAVMIYTDGSDSNINVTLSRNDIQQAGQPGIRVFGALNSGVRLESNRVEGASPALDVQTPGVVITPYTSGPVGSSN
jgi:Pectate lyase superfamily protein